MSAEHAAPGGRKAMLAALRHRDFTFVVAGQLVSAVGDGVLPVATTLALLSRGDGVLAIGGMLAARSLAMVAASLVGGVLADRFPRTRVMIGADALRLAAVVAIIVLLQMEAPATAIVLAMLVFGLGEALFRPAFVGLYPHLLPADLWQPGNAIGSLVSRSASIVGPALGGLLVVWTSPTAALWFDAATFVVSAVTLLLVRNASTVRHTGKRVWHDVMEGFHAVVARRWIGYVFLAGLIQMPLSVTPWLVLLPVVAVERYGTIAPYSICMSVYAVGAIVGALLAARIRAQAPGVPAILGVAVFSVVLLAMILPAPAAVLVAAHFVAGAGLEIHSVLWVTALQRGVPDELIGRVTALGIVCSACLMPVGYALTGAWAETAGRTTVLAVAAAASVVTTLPLLLDVSVRRLGTVSAPEAEPAMSKG